MRTLHRPALAGRLEAHGLGSASGAPSKIDRAPFESEQPFSRAADTGRMPFSLHALATGTVFAGEFRIVRLLGEGGMGAVYVAEQLSTGKLRALKTMHAPLVSNPQLRDRFVLEAQIGARIDSEHVVDVVAAGVDAATGMPWLAMELLQGDTLGDVVARSALDRRCSEEALLQLGNAIASAHAAGVVHRDLKPENVFLTRTKHHDVPFVLKVLDFGIAKLLQRGGSCATESVGTPLWMAPEQTELGSRVTPATDVWAFGLLAFYVLTGRSYWHLVVDGSTVSAPVLLRQIVLDELPPASVRARELGIPAHLLPPGFDAWFARCVTRLLHDRFASGAEALAALRIVLGRLPSPLASTELVPRAPLPSMVTMTGVASTRSPLAASRADSKLVAIVGALFALSMLGGLAWMAPWTRLPKRAGAGTTAPSSPTSDTTATTAPPIAMIAPKPRETFTAGPVELKWAQTSDPSDEYEVQVVRVDDPASVVTRSTPPGTTYAIWPWSGSEPTPGVYRWTVTSKSGATSWSELQFFPSTLDRVTSNHTLRVAMETTYHAPFVFYDPDTKQVTGFDVELAQAIADDLGVTLERQPRKWDQLFRDVETHDTDVVVSSVTITPERSKKAAFSAPYLKTGITIATRTTTPRILPPGKGRTLAAQRGTTAAAMATSRLAQATVREFDTLDGAFAALARGDVDGLLGDAVILTAREEVKAGGYRVQPQLLSKDGYGVMMAPGDERMRRRVDAALETLERSGKLPSLRKKYEIDSNSIAHN